VERVMQCMPDSFESLYVTPEEIGGVQAPLDVVHAHCWFECGQAAQRLASEKNLPYIIDVVQDDIRKYRKLLIFNKKSAESVLLDATRVVFTAAQQQNDLARHLSSKVADPVFAKSTLLYEPLPQFWLDSLHIHPPTALVHIKLLYVGALTDDSCLDNLLHAMHKLHRRNYPVFLTAVEDAIVESGYRQKMMREASKNDNFRIVSADNDETLREIYRSHDILWLPVAESTNRFAEALSQGLPVLYEHESVSDDIYKDGLAGYAVNTGNADEIARTILNVSDFFGTIEQQIMRLHPLGLFDAREQARHWEHLYFNAQSERK